MAAFLTASWVNLLMANFHIDKNILLPYVPAHTELDEWNGNYYVSLVGFLFQDTKVQGLTFPGHKTFEEVNLRFYVRYKKSNEWVRGVVFIKEIVPRAMITMIANLFYKEHYETREMAHRFTHAHDTIDVEYRWKVREWNYLKATASIHKEAIVSGSEEEFITEHYWGYTRLSNEKTSAYEVQHPKWKIHPVNAFEFKCDVAHLYGQKFEDVLRAKPTSVFLADGSPISVMNKQLIIS
ncbi:YqjF family protein [Pseudochryseolinea flava]|uniref:DUF2071 domain-containing protein n=1 Tax=Pseudochryseolinea flava TaxID=2059302 RepID=A0A364XVD5_9BACT|nr:DUF2071 domain-containing protein [Pseudochryseolinea flava]RAV98081.1 DUF2071 domain-containing protein [Pseudochryseolinea flava]